MKQSSLFVKYHLDRLPIFRSASQVALLVDLFVTSHRPATLSEIARRTGVSLAGVHKEVERLEQAGLVQSSRCGRNRLVEPNATSPHTADLRSLLMRAFGPPTLLGEALSNLDGIAEAFIYGSWAEGSGHANDIDLMVVGAPKLAVLYEKLRGVEDVLGIPVGVTVLSPDEWADTESGFLNTVRAGAKLQVL